MQVKYILQTQISIDKTNNKNAIYGISAIDNFGNVLKTVQNIFCNKQKAKTFIKLCNQEKLELIHLQDVIDDIS